MADVSITAASVAPGSGATVQTGIAGEAITAGMVVYRKPSDNKLYKADTSTSEKATAVGVACATAAGAGQVIGFVSAGLIAVGAVLTASVGYAVSDTGGGLRPLGDNATGDYITTVGTAADDTNLLVNISATGAQK